MKYSQEVTQEFIDRITNNGNSCPDAYTWYQTTTDKTWDGQLRSCVEQEKPIDWIINGITKTLTSIDNIRLALYAARQVEHIYELVYPGDDRVRKLNDATEAWINNPCEETRAARDAALAALDVTLAALDVTLAALDATLDARDATLDAALAALAALDVTLATRDVTLAALAAARATLDEKAVMIKICEYGIKLIQEDKIS